MEFPIARLAGRAALIGAMIAGGMLMAGIAQAQAQTAPAASGPVSASTSTPVGTPTVADRQAELVAAAGGPAPVGRLRVMAPERPAVEARDDDVANAGPDPSDALNAAQAAGPPARTDPTAPPAAQDNAAPPPPAAP